MSFLGRIVLVVAIIFSCNISLRAQSFSFKQIVFFGDSLSDNGNCHRAFDGMIPKSPPYFKGRFSNGFTWADHVAKHFETEHDIPSENFSFGGATVTWKYIWTTNLTTTVNRYSNNTPAHEMANRLFVIWIGTNDYLFGEDDVERSTKMVVSAIKRSTEQLINKGAQNILMINLPDISLAPQVREKGTEQYIKKIVTQHNSKLSNAIQELQGNHPNLNIQLFDTYNHFNAFLADPKFYNKKFGTNITNLKDSCWQGGYFLTRNIIDDNVTSRQLSGQRACPNPENYLFWDNIHPTATVHSVIAQIMIDYIQQTYH